jgi:hypothetical protein
MLTSRPVTDSYMKQTSIEDFLRGMITSLVNINDKANLGANHMHILSEVCPYRHSVRV